MYFGLNLKFLDFVLSYTIKFCLTNVCNIIIRLPFDFKKWYLFICNMLLYVVIN